MAIWWDLQNRATRFAAVQRQMLTNQDKGLAAIVETQNSIVMTEDQALTNERVLITEVAEESELLRQFIARTRTPRARHLVAHQTITHASAPPGDGGGDPKR